MRAEDFSQKLVVGDVVVRGRWLHRRKAHQLELENGMLAVAQTGEVLQGSHHIFLVRENQVQYIGRLTDSEASWAPDMLSQEEVAHHLQEHMGAVVWGRMRCLQIPVDLREVEVPHNNQM